MLNMLNPRVHIICGLCGCNNMLKFQIGTSYDDDKEVEKPDVTIICDNCDSITGLDEIIKEEIEE